MKFRNKIDQILGYALIGIMSLMVLNVLWQVFSRYFLGEPRSKISLMDVARFLEFSQHGTILHYLEQFPHYIDNSKYDTKELYEKLYTKYITYKKIHQVSTIEELENKRNRLIHQLAEITEEIMNYKKFEK